MSRINNEADRVAFNKWQKRITRAKWVAEWLAENPEIGTLNKGGGKLEFYKFVNGQMVMVEELAE